MNMRIFLLVGAGVLIGWLLIQIIRGRRGPLTRSAEIGVSVIRLLSYMVIGAAVVFIVFIVWQELN